MYMRLWWKDARQFWPIWAFLALAAVVTQLLVHFYASPESRGNILGSLAMGWPFLYAFAVGAAAFAGEREAGTRPLLDLLPASRRVVWAGKVSFAIVTTAALALLLLAMAALDVSPGGSPWALRAGGGPLELGALMLQALAWGLFCSAILGSALLAAVAAILLASVSRLYLDGPVPGPRPSGLAWELGLTLGLLVASLIAFAWGRRGRYGRLGLRLRSPIEVTWAGRLRPRAGTRRADRAPATPAASVSATDRRGGRGGDGARADRRLGPGRPTSRGPDRGSPSCDPSSGRRCARGARPGCCSWRSGWSARRSFCSPTTLIST